MRTTGVFALFASALLCQIGFAQLEFVEDHVKVKAAPSDEIVDVNFEFTVMGDKAIHIKEIDTSCGCLSAEAEKAVYKPGESGTIRSKFKLGSFEGEQTKTMKLFTSDPKTPMQKLTVTMTIPQLFSIEPQTQRWEVGEALTEKNITFKVLHQDPVEIVEVKCSRESFDFDVIEVKKGREYRIALKPKTTETPTIGMLRIITNCAIEKHQRKAAFFTVSRPKTAAKKTEVSVKKK